MLIDGVCPFLLLLAVVGDLRVWGRKVEKKKPQCSGTQTETRPWLFSHCYPSSLHSKAAGGTIWASGKKEAKQNRLHTFGRAKCASGSPLKLREANHNFTL